MTQRTESPSARADAMESEIKRLQQRLYCSAQELGEIRSKRLRSLLGFAKEHSPWYREMLGDVEVESFTEDQLSDLPPLDKATLMANWDDIVTCPDLTLDAAEAHTAKMSRDHELLQLFDRFHVLSTSGSSGQRAVYVYDSQEWTRRGAWSRRQPWLTGAGQAIAFSNTPVTIAQVVITNPVYGIFAATRSYDQPGLRVLYVPMTLPIEEICSRLNGETIDILMSIPSVLHKLSLEALEGRLEIEPTIVHCSGEPLYRPIRKLIEEAWPLTNVFNVLASSEGIYARNCRAGGRELHQNSDVCIVQPVDQRGEPVPPGVKPAKSYLTHLENYTLPLIRYESPDQLVLLQKECECGSKLQLIAEPEGRPEFDFVYEGDLFVHHLVFVTPLLHQRSVREYQVFQTTRGARIDIVRTGEVDTVGLAARICEDLKGLGLRHPSVEIRSVEAIRCPASGKVRRFIPIE